MRAELKQGPSIEPQIAAFGIVDRQASEATASLSASGLRRLALTLWGEGKPESAARFLHADGCCLRRSAAISPMRLRPSTPI